MKEAIIYIFSVIGILAVYSYILRRKAQSEGLKKMREEFDTIDNEYGSRALDDVVKSTNERRAKRRLNN